MLHKKTATELKYILCSVAVFTYLAAFCLSQIGH